LEFVKKYEKYWKHDKESEDTDSDGDSEGAAYKSTMTRMRKRRLQSLENINDMVLEQIESDAKKVLQCALYLFVAHSTKTDIV
jgi:hypothetical protein